MKLGFLPTKWYRIGYKRRYAKQRVQLGFWKWAILDSNQ